MIDQVDLIDQKRSLEDLETLTELIKKNRVTKRDNGTKPIVVEIERIRPKEGEIILDENDEPLIDPTHDKIEVEEYFVIKEGQSEDEDKTEPDGKDKENEDNGTTLPPTDGADQDNDTDELTDKDKNPSDESKKPSEKDDSSEDLVDIDIDLGPDTGTDAPDSDNDNDKSKDQQPDIDINPIGVPDSKKPEPDQDTDKDEKDQKPEEKDTKDNDRENKDPKEPDTDLGEKDSEDKKPVKPSDPDKGSSDKDNKDDETKEPIVNLPTGKDIPIPTPRPDFKEEKEDEIKMKADWDERKDGPRFTKFTLKALEKYGSNLLNPDLDMKKGGYRRYCKRYNSLDRTERKQFWLMFISGLSRMESGFRTHVKFTESFTNKGSDVISRGLLQISIASANQRAYGCGIKRAQDLHDPSTNLNCAVKILNHWIKKDHRIYGFQPKANGKKKWLGAARYWSPIRLEKYSGKKKERHERLGKMINRMNICR